MKLNFGSEAVMIVFILGLAFFTVVQPTFYPQYSTAPAPSPSPPAGGPTATPTPPGAGGNPAFFTIDPPATTISNGETLTLTLTLNTGDYEIDSVDLILNFDPSFLQAQSIVPGTIFPQYPVQKIEANQVQISAAGEIQAGQVVGFRGTGEYTRIIFQALETTDSTQVSFVGGDKGSKAVSVDTDRLDLSKCQPGNYKITD